MPTKVLRDALAAGRTSAFVGPVNKQNSSKWLAEGEFAPDGDILRMDFRAEGIVGELLP